MTDSKPMRGPGEPGGNQRTFAHALLFTGHMIDSADRTNARFPAWAEGRARAAIHAAIAGIDWKDPGGTVALAGAASGGDLLFHECCEELGIPTRVLLALPPEQFEATSVAPAGPGWVTRYHELLERALMGVEIMQQRDGSPKCEADNVWQQANLWMIEEGARMAAERALLALWDGKAGDGPGGTENFLEVARGRGVRILPVIDMKSLLYPAGT